MLEDGEKRDEKRVAKSKLRIDSDKL